MTKKSIYQCPVCYAEVESKPGRRVVCSKDKVEMEEVFHGVITKGKHGKA